MSGSSILTVASDGKKPKQVQNLSFIAEIHILVLRVVPVL